MTAAFVRELEHHGLDAGDITTIEETLGCKVHSFYAGEDLMRQGQVPLQSYLIIDGWAYRYKTLPNRRRQIVGILLPGDLSELHLFVPAPADHFIACFTPLTAVELTLEATNTFFSGSNPRIAQALWNKAFLATCIQREWTVNLGQRSGAERVGHILCELYHRLRKIGLTDDIHFTIPLTQRDLGRCSGLIACACQQATS